MKKLLTIFVAVLILAACEKPGTVDDDVPECIKEKIDEIEKEAVRNPPASIWQFEYKGETVYYIPPYCCDFYGTVYNSSCQIICHPDGGITGQGDGRCKDFESEAKNKKLIWKDSR